MLNDRFFPIIDLSFELHNFELVNPRRLPKQSQQGAFLVIFFSETYVRQMKKYHMGHRMWQNETLTKHVRTSSRTG